MSRGVCFLFTLVLAAMSPLSAAVIRVPAGGDLQAAISRARGGDTILLAAGATYTGNFILPARSDSAYVTIQTEGDNGLPRAGQRVSPRHAPRLAKLRSPNRNPALRTAAGSHHWRLVLLEFLPTSDGSAEIVALGDGSSAQSDLARVPRDLIIDRCYIHGAPGLRQKRGITLQSAATTITNSYISDIKAVGEEAHAIVGWNGPGPYTIENNFLEASGINFMLGGADPAIPGLVTEDVVFRRNHVFKRLAWRSDRWLVKNLFELKNARRVLIESNLIENVWRDGQVGYAMLLTPRNQGGRAPWAVVADVTVRRNVIRHAGGGIQILGRDDINRSETTERLTIVDNLFYDIDARTWGGTGAFVIIGNGPRNVTIEHNTVSQSGTIMTAYGGGQANPTAIPGFVFRDNAVRHNEFGVHGDGRSVGRDTLDTFFPGADFSSNAIAGGDARRYPAGNTFMNASEFDRQFVDPANGDFRLSADSRLRSAASDGRDVGADVAGIFQALGWRTRSR